MALVGYARDYALPAKWRTSRPASTKRAGALRTEPCSIINVRIPHRERERERERERGDTLPGVPIREHNGKERRDILGTAVAAADPRLRVLVSS